MDNTGRPQESGEFQGRCAETGIKFAEVEKVTSGGACLWIPLRRMAKRGQALDDPPRRKYMVESKAQ